jgi:ADP-dependent phosphofructokinase/glucokinase
VRFKYEGGKVKPVVALGFGNNVDYELVWSRSAVESILDSFDITDEELLHEPNSIRSTKDLLISLMTFMRSGKGGERFVESIEPINELARSFQYNVTVGGTGPRAALALDSVGVRSTIHLVTMNSHVREILPEKCTWTCSASQDDIYPHLIVQFNEGEQVRLGSTTVKAPNSNRVIYVQDPDNEKMRIAEDFFDELTHARVLLVSGFNAIHDRELLEERLQTIRRLSAPHRRHLKVIYEDACFHNPSFNLIAASHMSDWCDIHSLNEDELSEYVGTTIDLFDADKVADTLLSLRSKISSPTFVLHTKHWVLAYGDGAFELEHSMREGMTLAATRVRCGDDLSPHAYRETEALPEQPRSIDFARSIEARLKGKVCCVPAYKIQQAQMTTIGLGDAFIGGFIAGLVQQPIDT